MSRGSVGALAILFIAAALTAATLWFWPNPASQRPDATPPARLTSPQASRAQFDAWLAADPARAEQFAAFEAFLARESLSGIVPSWTLLRADARRTASCRADLFVLPPRRLWPNILPALRLLRDKVIPVVGRVEVASAYRDPTLNACSQGARGSRHLDFSALDLVPLDQPDAVTSFRRLCAAWRNAGPSSRWGLGGYLDLETPQHNRVGRFHVDGTGWRTWGFSYSRASSICNRL